MTSEVDWNNSIIFGRGGRAVRVVWNKPSSTIVWSQWTMSVISKSRHSNISILYIDTIWKKQQHYKPKQEKLSVVASEKSNWLWGMMGQKSVAFHYKLFYILWFNFFFKKYIFDKKKGKYLATVLFPIIPSTFKWSSISNSKGLK